MIEVIEPLQDFERAQNRLVEKSHKLINKNSKSDMIDSQTFKRDIDKLKECLENTKEIRDKIRQEKN